MPTYIIQPSGADCYFAQAYPTLNYNGSQLVISSHDGGTPHQNYRTIIKFDFSEIPDGLSITVATLELYNLFRSGSAGRTYWAYRLTQTSWGETTACWNTYDGSNNWSTLGGDYTTTDGASAIVPSSNDWMSWNVLNQILYAYTHGKIAHFLIRDNTENDAGSSNFYSKNEATQLTLRPKLTIVAPVAYTKTLSESVSLTESKIKKPVSKRSDSFTLSEIGSRRPRHPVSGDAFTLSEVSIRKPRPVRSEVLNLTDVFGKVSSSKQSLSDSFTLSESKTKRSVLPQTAAITLSEASIRKPRLVRSETITPLDANAKRVVKPKTDTFTLSEAKIKKPTKPFTDAFTLSEASIRKPTLRKTDILILAPDYMKATYDEDGAPPAILKLTLALKEFMSPSESMVAGFSTFRIFADSLTPSDQVSTKPGKLTSDSFSFIDSIIKREILAKPETISISDAKILKPNKVFSDQFTLTEARIKRFVANRSEALSIIDLISKRPIPALKTDTLTLSEASVLKPIMRRVFSEIMTLTDVQARVKTFRRAFPDSVTLSDYEINNLIKVLWNRKAIVMSLNNYGVTEYPNYNFNSLVQFNDVLLGANENGIYILSGPDDLGVDIQANIESGLYDFREDGDIKYPREGWLFYRADGNLSLIIKCDEDAEYETILEKVGTHIKEIRAKFGKGIKARAFNFELKNVDGSDFDIQSLRILGEMIPSRKR